MDYLLYILAILVIGLVCLVTIRVNFKKTDDKRRRGGKSVTNRPSDSNQVSTRDFKPALQRALLHIRTPWGWPRHLEHNRIEAAPQKSSRRSRENAGRNASANSRIDASMRALLEDRYGRGSPQAMTEMEYRKVKAPRLRDPSEPHDQMDNFGTREADRIRQKLKLLTAMNTKSDVPEALEDLRYVELKDIKRPWGW